MPSRSLGRPSRKTGGQQSAGVDVSDERAGGFAHTGHPVGNRMAARPRPSAHDPALVPVGGLHVPSSQSWYDAHGTDRDDRLSTNDVPVTPGTMALSAGWPDDRRPLREPEVGVADHADRAVAPGVIHEPLQRVVAIVGLVEKRFLATLRPELAAHVLDHHSEIVAVQVSGDLSHEGVAAALVVREADQDCGPTTAATGREVDVGGKAHTVAHRHHVVLGARIEGRSRAEDLDVRRRSEQVGHAASRSHAVSVRCAPPTISSRFGTRWLGVRGNGSSPQLEVARHLERRQPLAAEDDECAGRSRGLRAAPHRPWLPRRSGSATGTTAASTTVGCMRSTASTSAGAMFSPPRRISSLRLPWK